MKKELWEKDFATLAIHGGELHPGPLQAHVTPIFQSSTYVFQDTEIAGKLFMGEAEGYVYARMGNPNMNIIERKVALLEGGNLIAEHRRNGDDDYDVQALSFASGMAAISTLLFSLLKPGDRIIAQSSLYGGTVDLLNTVIKKYQIEVTWITTGETERFQRALEQHPEAKMIFAETPANPMLTVVDIAALAELAHSRAIPLVVDNTFATPYLQRPLELGADYVIHSMTKYLGGHGVVVGGMLVTPHLDMLRGPILENRHHMGGVPGPMDSWLLNMGIKTLPLRMEKHCDNAEHIARYLAQHPKIAKVYYPGLPEDPNHTLAWKQMKRFGGMISFEMKGGFDAGAKLMNSVKLMTLAVSLGTVDTLIQHPASMTHSHVPKELREATGITDGLVRLSVGLEDVEDLLEDLDQALAAV